MRYVEDPMFFIANITSEIFVPLAVLLLAGMIVMPTSRVVASLTGDLLAIRFFGVKLSYAVLFISLCSAVEAGFILAVRLQDGVEAGLSAAHAERIEAGRYRQQRNFWMACTSAFLYAVLLRYHGLQVQMLDCEDAIAARRKARSKQIHKTQPSQKDEDKATSRTSRSARLVFGLLPFVANLVIIYYSTPGKFRATVKQEGCVASYFSIDQQA
jgi:hypothetical protein